MPTLLAIAGNQRLMARAVIYLAKVAVLVTLAVLVGIAATVGAALLGHEVLVLAYGENLAPIDDTPPMVIAVSAAYIGGVLSGLSVLVIGWRRVRP